MSAMDAPDPLTVPPGTRVFYIGPPKTGTTSLQEAAHARRQDLSEHGVYFPGTSRNHRKPVFALLREPDWLSDWVGDKPLPPGTHYQEAGRVHPMSEWTRLMEDVASHPDARAVVTHEWAASASDEEARAFAEGLGPDRIHVVITLRPLTQVLPSQWIECLKEGVTADLEHWLEALYRPGDDVVPVRMRRYLDHAGVVERWARVVGRENVTVIVVDKADRDLLLRTFERLLGLPERMLTGVVDDRLRTNRSMTLLEAQVLQQANEQVMRPEEMSWRVYLAVMRVGVITELLDARSPGEDEPRVVLPEWAQQRAARAGAEHAQRIAATGVRVVGDLGRLHGDVGAVPQQSRSRDDADAFRSIAVLSVVGAMRAATAYEHTLARRIDLARQATAKEKELRAQAAQALEQERTGHREAERLLERERAEHQQTRDALERERAEHQQTRDALDRSQRRTIRDQVAGMPAARRPHEAARSFTTHDLARACAMRLRHRLRTRRSLRLG